MNAALFILLALLWGGSFPAIKLILAGAEPIFGAALRLALSLLLLTIISLALRKKRTVPLECRTRVWLAGLFSMGIPWSLLFWGEQVISPGLAGILNSTAPLWTFLLAAFFLREDEQFTGKKSFGVLIGFVGILLIYLPRIAVSGSKVELLGLIAITLMAICYGIGVVLNRTVLMQCESLSIYGHLFQQHLAALLFVGTLSFFFEGTPQLSSLFASWKIVGAILYLAFFSTALAMLLFYHLVRAWGAMRAVAVTYVIPVSALLFDYLLFGNIPTFFEIAGAATIITGTFLVQTRASSIASPAICEAAVE